MKSINNVTPVGIEPSTWRLNIKSKVVTIGSCFAEVLGDQLETHKFDACNNPFGTIFNPLTISKLINQAIDSRPLNPALYIENTDGIWLHHDLHSSIWGHSKAEIVSKMESKLQEVRQFLQKADLLVLTFGTAFAYRHKGTNQLIGNCHKLPADRFIKELLNNDQIQNAVEEIIFKLLTYNRKLKIMVTVSPVRHTRDTLPLNQVSKSILRLLCHRLSDKFPHITYFPAYEIMQDELRDYCYYKEDLIHPNRLAEEHIFDVFKSGYLDEPAKHFVEQWATILQMLNHKPNFGHTASYQNHLKRILEKLIFFSENVNVDPEIEAIRTKMSEYLA